MEMIDAQKQYSLSREAASRLLKVSIRTLDRYIRAKKMSTRVVDARVWLNKEEVEAFKAGKGRVIEVDRASLSTAHLSIDDDMDRVDNVEVLNQEESVDMGERQRAQTFSRNQKTGSQNETYKNLYNELKEEVKEKQERLEIANYRVGQLEAQVKSSVPLLEYHREKYETKKTEEEFKSQINESANMIKRLSLSIKYERFSKRIFLIILLIILALQPLWLVIRFSSSG